MPYSQIGSCKTASVQNMRRRGLGEIQLSAADGAAAIITATETWCAQAARQGWLEHGVSDLVAKVPEDLWLKAKA